MKALLPLGRALLPFGRAFWPLSKSGQHKWECTALLTSGTCTARWGAASIRCIRGVFWKNVSWVTCVKCNYFKVKKCLNLMHLWHCHLCIVQTFFFVVCSNGHGTYLLCATHFNTLQHTATLRHTAPHCNTLQHTAWSLADWQAIRTRCPCRCPFHSCVDSMRVKLGFLNGCLH